MKEHKYLIVHGDGTRATVKATSWEQAYLRGIKNEVPPSSVKLKGKCKKHQFEEMRGQGVIKKRCAICAMSK